MGIRDRHIPMRCTHSRKGRNKIYTFRRHKLCTEIICVLSTAEKSHFVTQPLYNSTADKYTAFQCICHLSIYGTGDCCYKSVFAFGRLCACVHKYEIACSVGVFYITLIKAELSEKSRLLISGYSGNGYLCSANIGIAVYFRAVFNLREH